MAGNGSEKSKDFLNRLAELKKRSYEVKFDLDGSDYTAVENIGIGAYGVVCSAIHKKSQDRVAIKKIHKAFEFEKIATRTYREIKILKHFKHDNIISIRDILKPKGSVTEFMDIYIVLDLMESDLHRIIYSKQELTEEHVRYFLYQLLRGLKYIHSAKVIHRDLKPSNLLVNEDCQLKIGDFGMARGLLSNPEEPNHYMTQYVATRWYRAPEIMLSMVEYSSGVDMWSVGCIFAEMLGRKHLFPGKDYIQQIRYIIGVLGSPSQAVMDLCNSDLIKNFVKQLGKREGIAWTTLFPKASRKAINLLSRILVLHPGERITVEEALKHHYLSKYHDPDDEPVCVPAFNFDFENQQLNLEQLRDMIYTESMEYHQPKTFNAFLRPAPKEPSVSKATVTTEQVVPESSKVKVEVGNLEPRSLADVEMHSAKVEDSKKETIHTVDSQKAKDATKSEVKGQEGHTVSSNTKELIKAALMNANLRKQRQESLNEENNKNKPITAAQRQREREEKRRKKKEKSLEKMKKKKGPKGIEKVHSLLTNEDKEMLERWAKMQKNVQQIAPKPDPSQSQNRNEQTITIINIQQQVITIPKQTEPSNQGQQTADATSVGTKSFSQHAFGIQNLSGQRGSLPVHSDLNESEKIQIPPERRESDSCVYQIHRQENKHNLLSNLQQKNVSESTKKSENVPGFSTINMQDLKSLGITNMPLQEPTSFANVDGSSDKLHTSSSNETLENPSHNFTNRRSPYSQGSPSKDYSNNGSPESYTSQGSPENFLNTSDSSEHSQTNLHATNVSQNVQPAGMQNFQNFTQNAQFTSQSNEINSNAGNLSTNFSNQMTSQGLMSNQTQAQEQLRSNHGNTSQNYTSQQTSEVFPNQPSREMQPSFFSSSYTDSFLGGQSFQDTGSFQPYESQHSHQNKLSRRASSNQDFSDFTSCQYDGSMLTQFAQSFEETSNIPQQQNFQNYDQVNNTKLNDGSFSEIGSGFMNHNQNFQQDFGLPSSFTTQPGFIPSSSTSIPFQGYASNQSSTVTQPLPSSQLPVGDRTIPSKQPALQINTNMPSDLISVLSKQFSKSQVEDPCPPVLALTPRGTGAGYGLGMGMDLDSLIMDSQDTELGRAEPSPLSSSLLTDWMDVTGDLNIDMDALEQELSLQSPMTLSYSDLSMYPS
ncbi:Hypothetical predicted protein [Mytilus galloprovincialis]|uniref:Mitogen-activated protein kinase n=1 Tax=Mytilus galloprovincialis TaxID=29158 RepID=A0A8B6F513_MYTGA|nr:Hypothetical predicted protein [Mytilus galloprovincialis]VDI44497.1 Hypothetical predicted protein [Mytilus galloprovincialis]